MTIVASGPIWMTSIRDEFLPGSGTLDLYNYYRSFSHVTDNPENNNIAWDTSAPIYFSQFYGAYKSYGGSWDSSSPGSYSLYVPSFAWLRLRVWGAGAGGQGLDPSWSYYINGSPGENSAVSGYLQGNGGQPNGRGGASGGNTENVVGGGSPGGAAQYLGQAGYAGGFSHSLFGQGYARYLNPVIGAGGARAYVFTAAFTPYPQPGAAGRVLVEWGV